MLNNCCDYVEACSRDPLTCQIFVIQRLAEAEQRRMNEEARIDYYRPLSEKEELILTLLEFLE